MGPLRLPNGNLLVPVRVESDDGVVGDTMLEVEPGSPEYLEWEPHLDAEDAQE